MRKPIKRVRYKLKSMYDYVQEKGIEFKDLTDEERKMFEAGRRTFHECMWPLKHKEECFICGTKTGYVDKILTVYLCTEECMNEVDSRYNSGEEIHASKVAQEILDRISAGLN